MKRWIIVLLLLLTPAIAFAVDNWHTANQITVAWDAVTQLSDGSPVPPTSTINYKIYIRPDGAASPITEIASGTATQATITLVAEGKYVAGIKAVRIESGETISESAISWSDDPIVVSAAGTFGVIYFRAPKVPGGLRKQ